MLRSSYGHHSFTPPGGVLKEYVNFSTSLTTGDMDTVYAKAPNEGMVAIHCRNNSYVEKRLI